MSQIEKAFSRTEDPNRPHLNEPLAYAAVASYILRIAKLHDRFRDALPEPIDVADHLGNIDISIGLSVLSTKVLFDRLRDRHEQERYREKDRRNAMFFGFAAVSILNGISETKWGVKTIPVFPGIQHEEGADPNMIDAAYGVGSAALGARFAFRRQKRSR